MTLALLGVALLIALTIGLGVYLGRTLLPVKNKDEGARFPAAIGGLVCLAWLGIFSPWAPKDGGPARDWDFVRIGPVDLPNVFLVGAAAAVFIFHSLGALLRSRWMRGLAILPAAYGTGHAGLFLFALVRQRQTAEVGPAWTLACFVALLGVSSAIAARKHA